MRPSEIDFNASRRRHFFDLENGEILQGQAELKQYINEGANSSYIVNLGCLLREGVDLGGELPYEPLDVSDWSKEKYLQFGRWLSKIIPPPTQPNHSHLSGKVLENARAIGIGPNRRAIRKVFGTVSLFYSEIGETDAHHIGLFSDWGLDDFVRHIKTVGGAKRPTTSQLRAFSDRSPKYPKPDYMRARFKAMGGLRTLFELAGYPVIDLWEKQDYIDWGVMFMEANNGIVPTSRMADYLSQQKRGPSGTTIISHFDYMRSYQAEILKAYEESQQEKANAEAQKLARFTYDLRNGYIPLELFQQQGVDVTIEDSHATSLAIESLSLSRPVISQKDAEVIESDLCAQLSNQEVMLRYAMLKVLYEAIPYASLSAQVNIVIRAREEEGQNFIREIRRRYDEKPGVIENAALVLGFFDDIWPMNQHLATLKLDNGYLEYYKKIEKVKKIISSNVLSATSAN